MDNTEHQDNQTVLEPAPNKNSSKVKMLGITLLSIAVIALAWYFLYFTKTPEYSLNAVRASIVNHEVDTFKKYVDVDSLLSHGYDDTIAAYIASEPKLSQDNFSKSLVEGLAKLFKGMAITEGKESILRYVETGKLEKEDAIKTTGSTPANTPSTKNVVEQTGLKDASFRGLAYTKIDGKVANVGLKILVKETNQEVVVDVKMQKLSDGSWRIVQITNLKDLLLKANEIKNSKDANPAVR